MKSDTIRLFYDLTIRELRNRLSISSFGAIWVVTTPILLLSVYTFVFEVIFRARVPSGLELPFVVWLSIGLWPWLAFSESSLRGSQAIRQHRALISKVAIERSLLVTTVSTAAFLLQIGGYLVILGLLYLLGIELSWAGLPYAGLTLITLYLFSAGIGLCLSALQVFIRDLEQVLPILFMLWFFLTPILYAPEMLPSELEGLLSINPMTWWMNALRSALLDGQILPDKQFLVLILISSLTYSFGHFIFARLSPYFEDFL